MNVQLILLAAGKPYIGLYPSHLTPLPSSLNSVTEYEQRIDVFTWIQTCFKDYDPVVECVLGYHAEASLHHHTHVRYHVNPLWKETGACHSLLTVPLEEDLFIHYSDILIQRQKIKAIFDQIDQEHIIICVDTEIKTRETLFIENQLFFFVGCAFIPKKYIALLHVIEKDDIEFSKQHIGYLLRRLIEDYNLPFKKIIMDQQWCSLDDPKSLPSFFLGTKAHTLQRLTPFLKHSTILPLVIISYDAWLNDSKSVIRTIIQMLGIGPWIVRSSSFEEDGFETSAAGAFDSFLDVTLENIEKFVTNTFAAYRSSSKKNDVLVQPMLKDGVTISGVVFTQSLEGAPYYTINYTQNTQDTTGITGGHASGYVLTIFKETSSYCSHIPWVKSLLNALQEIESIIAYNALDIEFCMQNDKVTILQVRPLIVKKESLYDSGKNISYKKIIQQESSFFEKISLEKPLFLSVMSDWNPAEMIGFSPKPLAYSLYQNLITDDIWATQRFEFGYQDLRSHPLMLQLCGHPYIDVRKSIQSFLPESLPKDMVEKITDFSIEFLKDSPGLHDKIEFDIIPTCFGFSFSKWHQHFSPILSANELHLWENSLISLTKNAFDHLDQNFERVDVLHSKSIVNLKNTAHTSPWFVIKNMIDNIKKYGTLPFAHLARCGFIASTFLRDIEERQWMSKERIDAFLKSIETVSSHLQRDAFLVKDKKLEREIFYHTYGHLRPGTYDIETPTYLYQKEIFLDPLIDQAYPFTPSQFSFTEKERSNIETHLKSFFDLSFDQFERFLRQSIYGREYGKFIFTRHLSSLLSFIEEEFLKEGLAKNLLPFLTLDDIKHFYKGSIDFFRTISCLTKALEYRKNHYFFARSIPLPPTLHTPKDFFIFTYPQTHPNFITQKSIAGFIYNLPKIVDENVLKNICGKIIFIEKADPGFDWLFSYPIQGLVTLYGGANSHMAIRCHEFGLPAAIGVGTVLYQTLLKSTKIRLDCAQRIIQSVQ